MIPAVLGQQKAVLVFCGTVSVWVGKVGYLVVLGEYNLVLLNLKCYLVSKWLSCLYTLKEVET